MKRTIPTKGKKNTNTAGRPIIPPLPPMPRPTRSRLLPLLGAALLLLLPPPPLPVGADEVEKARRRRLAACTWGASTSGTFAAQAADCTHESEIHVAGSALVLEGTRRDPDNLVRVTRGGSGNYRRFFRLGTNGRIEIAWLHLTGGRAHSYGDSHGQYENNNAGFLLGLGKDYTFIIRDSRISDMQAQMGGAVTYHQYTVFGSTTPAATGRRFESWRTVWTKNKADLGAVLHLNARKPYQVVTAEMSRTPDSWPSLDDALLVDSTFVSNTARLNGNYVQGK